MPPKPKYHLYRAYLMEALDRGLTEAELCREKGIPQSYLNRVAHQQGIKLVKSARGGSKDLAYEVYAQAIKDNPGMSGRQIGKLLGVSSSSVYRAIERFNIPWKKREKSLTFKHLYERKLYLVLGDKKMRAILKSLPEGGTLFDLIRSCLEDVYFDEVGDE